MNLRLDIQLENPELTTLEGLQLEFQLENTGSEPLSIPGSNDRSSAIGVEIFTVDGALFRRFNGLTHQSMMSASPPNDLFEIEELEGGESWHWDVDLATYHYALAEGEYEIRATFNYVPLAMKLTSPRYSFRVLPAPIVEVHDIRDNPIVDALTMLYQSPIDGHLVHFLRLYNPTRPLACWYSQRVLTRANVDQVFCAQASSYQDETFDEAERRWVVWLEGREVLAQAFDEGIAEDGNFGRGTLPKDRELLRTAHYDREDRLFVFMLDKDGILECHQLGKGGLKEVFVYWLPPGLDAAPVIGVDEEFVHVIYSQGGLTHVRLDHQGLMLSIRQLFQTRLPLYSCRYDGAEDSVKAIFWDTPAGKTVEVAVASLNEPELSTYRFEQIRLRGELEELAFDRGTDDAFHLLVATSKGKLYYFQEGDGPWLVDQIDGKAFPRVVAAQQTYLGYYRNERGYRFVMFDPYSEEGRIVKFEALE
jgi:hypothetical protein